MASPSSFRPSPLLPRSPLFTPIPELDQEGELDDAEPEPKPKLPPSKRSPAPSSRKGDSQLSVLCSKCRPSSRDKSTTVVPLDNNYGSTPLNPKSLLQSLLLSLTRTTNTKSPNPAPSASTSEASSGATDEWRLAAQELSRKLLHATRRRDEALLEASRLKSTVADLERKLDRLESYCLDLKSEIGRAVSVGPAATTTTTLLTDRFIAAVADARTAVRSLARSLSVHVRPARIASVLRLPTQNTGNLLIYLESILNMVFYQDFDKLTDEESKILDPAVRSEMNQASYEAVRGLTWEEVLSKGTKHYSEGLSKFCDKKMSEVVGMMGWARAWPESLLQAFFGAAKGVWAVCLLSKCVQPAVPVMRVEKGMGFDGKYMEDMAVGEKGRRARVTLTPVSVRMVVAPGFYLYAGGFGVIKCKVVCGYGGNSD